MFMTLTEYLQLLDGGRRRDRIDLTALYQLCRFYLAQTVRDFLMTVRYHRAPMGECLARKSGTVLLVWQVQSV